MKSKTVDRLRKSKDKRSAYVAAQINIGIPFQIRALREQREWSQTQLAEYAGMLQPRISAMESPGTTSFTLETLKRLASAFDVALIVRFAPFGELIRWADNFSPDHFRVPSFDKENFSQSNIVNLVQSSTSAFNTGKTRLIPPITTQSSGYSQVKSAELTQEVTNSGGSPINVFSEARKRV